MSYISRRWDASLFGDSLMPEGLSIRSGAMLFLCGCESGESRRECSGW